MSGGEHMFSQNREARRRTKESEARKAELRAGLLADDAGSRHSKEARMAVAYCEKCIAEYEWWFNYNEAKWYFLQKVTIIGGVIATFAGVITIPASWMTWAPEGWQSLSWVRGVPAAIVTIAASYLGNFNYREDAVRHELTANALWNELAKYQVHAHPYDGDDSQDTSIFMNNICRIVDSELRNWSAVVKGQRLDSETAENALPGQDENGSVRQTGQAQTPSARIDLI